MARLRRTRTELTRLNGAIVRITAEYNMTVRHLFYRLVGEGVIEKTEGEYKKIVRHCGQLREDGRIPFSAIIDQSRRFRWRATYENAGDALSRWARYFKAPLWDSLDVQPILTIEKEAVSAIFEQLCDDYDCPMFPLKGYSSKTFLREIASVAAAAAADERRPIIFSFGDHDPSGAGSITSLQSTVKRYFSQLEGDPRYAPRFIKLGVTVEQIEQFNLPTRPVKKTDSRAKGWTGGCVEMDAMLPAILTGILETELRSLMPAGHLASVREFEEHQIERLMEAAHG